MGLGGGTFKAQNKILPGVYTNFISAQRGNTALGDRGYATMPLELNWGRDDEISEITYEKFKRDALKLFGYTIDHASLKGVREIFKNASTLYAYRINGGGTKAENEFAIATCSGTRGNDIKIVIQINLDDTTKYDVFTIIGTTVVDRQKAEHSRELVNNDYVTFKPDEALIPTAGTPLTGGTNGTVTGESHSKYLEKIEPYSFNAMGVVTTDDETKALYINFCKRMREEVGSKFQLVVYNIPADYEGVINVKNSVSDAGTNAASLVYWVTGLQAGCQINRSCMNRLYDGEYTVNADYTQAQLEVSLSEGEFVLHKVGFDIRVLSDINSYVTVTKEKGEVFRDNQTIRIIDKIANDVAALFNNKYMGNMPNDDDGRTSLWADLIVLHEGLQDMGVIENFVDSDITVLKGDNKKSVVVQDTITVINAMEKLYMTVEVA